MASSYFIIFLIWILYIFIPPSFTICGRYEQTCDDGAYCISQTAKVIYPDPKTFFATDAVMRKQDYVCNSQSYCHWAQTWGHKCVRFTLEETMSASFYDEATATCSTIDVPIKVNQSVSCCQPDVFDCAEVIEGTRPKFESLYTTENCVLKPELSDIVSGIVECYATPDFMRYLKCNESNFVDQCPPYWFRNLEVYAKCSCSKLGSFNDESWQFFKEMTQMVEGIFESFRHKEKRENCPDWRFSCNHKGEAQLDVFEIVCPLVMYEDTDLNQVLREVHDGVHTLSEDQVEIFDNVIRVLMYSEEEAIDALDWLALNTTDTTPDEIGAPCDMEETVWNLNELYGDYIPPTTPEPTDNAFKFMPNSVFIVVLIASFSVLL